MQALTRLWVLVGLSWSAVCLASEDSTATTKLHRAVFEDDTESALRLLEAGADPDAVNAFGVTVLSLACSNGNQELVEALVGKGADPNQKAETGETPLILAAKVGRLDSVKVLLEYGAQLKGTNASGQTALMWAASEGNVGVLNFLLKKGSDPNRKLKSGFTPMLFAARNGHRDIVVALLEAGVDVNYAADEGSGGRGLPDGSSALSVAVENGHFDLADQLLRVGANPDDQRSGASPLHILTWVRKPNRGDGFDGMPSPQGSGSMNTLDFAARLVEKYGADVDLKLADPRGNRFGMRGDTPFILAARKEDLAYLKQLHRLGADPNATNMTRTTPLLAAAGVDSRTPEEEAGNEAEALEVVQWLVSLEADVNAINGAGETSMHGAAYRNFPELVFWLSENGADIELWNKGNKKRWTPLLIARGYRPGNFKPSAATELALIEVMKGEGAEIPPLPDRKPSGQY